MHIYPQSFSQNNGCIEFEVKESQENITSILKCLLDANVKVYACNQKEIELEKVFEKMIQNDNK
jgi:hypothetical protein